LYRNGMWITNLVPKNRPSDFAKFSPFNAVILLDPDDAERACDLVRKAEGPRHIDLDPARLGRANSNPQRESFDALFLEIHERLKKLAPEQDAYEMDPGFFTIEVSDDGIRLNPNSRKGRTGHPERISRPKPRGGKGSSDSDGPSEPNLFKRQGDRLEAVTVAVPRNGGVNVCIRPREKAKNVELRLVQDSGIDATCDAPEPEKNVEILKGVTVDGEEVNTYFNNKVGTPVAVLLGSMKEQEEKEVWVPCKVLDPNASIQVELVKRAKFSDKESDQ